MKKIPGPKHNAFIKGASEMQKSPLVYMQKMDEAYPGIANWKLLHLNIIHLSDPKLIRAVLQTNQKQYVKNTAYKQLKLILGNGLVTSEGELWRRQRKLIQPSFHKQSVYNFFNTMLASTNEMVNEWKEKLKTKKEIDFSQEMMGITLQIIGKTMLSADVKMEAKNVGNSIAYLLKAIDQRAMKAINLPLWMPLPSHFKFKSERKVLDDIIYKIISERRKTKEKKDDLLDMLMESRYEDTGEAMPDELLKDELMTIFLAGHETTASALTSTFYLISQHPKVYEKLKKEIDEVVGKEEMTFRHFQQLKYTKACLNEAMRLYPPVWMVGRRALEDNMVGDYLIKKDTDILISPYIVHHHPDYWKNPETFDPDRWETEEVKEMDKFTYFPFAAGPRMCIGNNFALFEADIIITKIIQNFSFEYLGQIPPPMDPSITLRVKVGHGMPMRVSVLE
jgi:cytochrome P450